MPVNKINRGDGGRCRQTNDAWDEIRLTEFVRDYEKQKVITYMDKKGPTTELVADSSMMFWVAADEEWSENMNQGETVKVSLR